MLFKLDVGIPLTTFLIKAITKLGGGPKREKALGYPREMGIQLMQEELWERNLSINNCNKCFCKKVKLPFREGVRMQ